MSQDQSPSPLSVYQQAKQCVRYWTDQANALLAADARSHMPLLDVTFDLRGRSAGVTVARKRRRRCDRIRLNAELLLSRTHDMIDETIPHEVAHAAARWFYGTRIKPHGQEWRAIMHAFGKQATTCHELPTVPARRVTYYPYDCGCVKANYLSATRHRRAQLGEREYRCKYCQQALEYTGGPPTRGHPGESV